MIYDVAVKMMDGGSCVTSGTFDLIYGWPFDLIYGLTFDLMTCILWSMKKQSLLKEWHRNLFFFYNYYVQIMT